MTALSVRNAVTSPLIILVCALVLMREVNANSQSVDAPGAEGVMAMGAASSKSSPTNTAASRLSSEYQRNPFRVSWTNEYGKILTEYRYLSTNLPPNDPPPPIRIEGNVAVARGQRHTIVFQPDILDPAAVSIHIPNQSPIRGRVSAISMSDADGTRYWLGEIRSAQGEISEDAPNRIIYRDAFEGIRADVAFQHTQGRFEQDVILREAPETPDDLDLDTAKFEVWTEFVEAPLARVHAKSVPLRGSYGTTREQVSALDEVVEVGGIRIETGKTYTAPSKGLKQSNRGGGLVAKKWFPTEQGSILLEYSDYQTMREALGELALRKVRNVGAPERLMASVAHVDGLSSESLERRAAWTRPGEDEALYGHFCMASSRAGEGRTSDESGVVLDYIAITGLILNINFGTEEHQGPAAVGVSSSDFWNRYANPGGVINALPNPPNDLYYSDGITRSTADLWVSPFANGVWGNASVYDNMMRYYIYPNGLETSMIVKVQSLSPGDYDFYIYGVWSPNNENKVNGKYALRTTDSVGNLRFAYGEKTTFPLVEWDRLRWTEGEHYALFRNVHIGSGEIAEITCMSGAMSTPIINGIQVVPGQTVNHPPVLTQLPHVTLPPNTSYGPVTIQISDADGPMVQSASISSDNQAVVANSQIMWLENSATRIKFRLKTASAASGSARITLTVSDGIDAATTSFVVTIDQQMAGAYAEVPNKQTWPVTSSTEHPAPWLKENVRDGVLADPGWHNDGTLDSADWIRVDLGTTYPVGRVTYYPRGADGCFNGRFLHYRVYVTDIDSRNEGDWGDAVLDGTWEWTALEVKTISFPLKYGRYVILRCLTGEGSTKWASANEIGVYYLKGIDVMGGSFHRSLADRSLPFPVPGVLEAEEYNLGGGMDLTAGNTVGRFRPDPLEPADSTGPHGEIVLNGTSGGGYSLELEHSESQSYQIEVPPNQQAYTYTVSARAKMVSPSGSPVLRVSAFQGVSQVGNIIASPTVPSSWANLDLGEIAFPGPGIYNLRLESYGANGRVQCDRLVVKRKMPSVVIGAGRIELSIGGEGGLIHSISYPGRAVALANAQAIRVALANPSLAQGGRLLFPTGTFHLREQNVLASDLTEIPTLASDESQTAVLVQRRKNIEICGVATNKTFLVSDNRSTIAFYFEECENIYIHDISFQGRPYSRPRRDLDNEMYAAGGGWTPSPSFNKHIAYGDSIYFASGRDTSLIEWSHEWGRTFRGKGLLVQNCAFYNQGTRGIQLKGALDVMVRQCNFANFVDNAVTLSDGIVWDGVVDAAVKGHVGLLSHGDANMMSENLHLVGNTYDGNLQWRKLNSGRPNAAGSPDHATDGLAWLQSGGAFHMDGNTVINYGLEAFQVNGGPAVLVNNAFGTEEVVGAAVAGKLFACGLYERTTMRQIYWPALQMAFYFASNMVTGGRYGVVTAPADNSPIAVPRDYNVAYKLWCSANSLSLPTIGTVPSISFGLRSAEYFGAGGNVVSRATRGIHADVLGGTLNRVPSMNIRSRCNDFSGVDTSVYIQQASSLTPTWMVQLVSISDLLGRSTSGAYPAHILIDCHSVTMGVVKVSGCRTFWHGGGEGSIVVAPSQSVLSWDTALPWSGLTKDLTSSANSGVMLLYGYTGP